MFTFVEFIKLCRLPRRRYFRSNLFINSSIFIRFKFQLRTQVFYKCINHLENWVVRINFHYIFWFLFNFFCSIYSIFFWCRCYRLLYIISQISFVIGRLMDNYFACVHGHIRDSYRCSENRLIFIHACIYQHQLYENVFFYFKINEKLLKAGAKFT